MPKQFISGILFIGVLLAFTGCERPTPEQLRERQHLPDPGFKGDIKIGAQLFNANCARCHGAEGRGSDQGPPLVNKIYRPGHHSDLTFHTAIKNGTLQHHWHFGDMPPIEGVSPEDATHIIAYIRHEQRQAGIN